MRNTSLTSLTLLLLLLGLRAGFGVSSTNIQDVYTDIGFDHTAPGNGVIIQLTDIHFCSLGDRANFFHDYWDPPAISNMINLRMPRATEQVMIVTGDLSQSNADYGSQQPHAGAGMEFEWAKRALDCVTNIDWYYAGPGNHDADNRYRMTGEIPLRAAVFHQPPYTNFVVAGMPVVYFNGGDVDVLDPPQQEWMAALKPTFDKSKEIFLATHQNPWMNTPSGAHFLITREQFRDMEWFMRGWRTNINFMIGHSHGDAYVNFRSGPNKVRLFYSPPSRTATKHRFHTGFMVYCISEGRLVGAVIAFTDTQLFTGIDLNTGRGAPLYVNINYPYIRPWEECGNVLFRVEEGAYNRADYSVTYKAMFDANTLLHYCRRYTVRLPGDAFPAATRALVALNITNTVDRGTNYPVEVYLGSAPNLWTNYPIQGFTNFIARVDIPESLRGAPIWMMVTNTAPGDHDGAMDAAGFGLGTTNAITGFEAWCGRELGDYRISKETELWPGVTAWTAYFFGMDPRRLDPSREIVGNPWLTIGPAAESGDVVLNWSTVTGRVYTVEWSTNSFGGFQTLEAASNLPPEITSVTNSTTSEPLFYRLKVQEQ